MSDGARADFQDLLRRIEAEIASEHGFSVTLAEAQARWSIDYATAIALWQRLQDSVPPQLRTTTDVFARVVSGTPADEIVTLASDIDADLIVMGVTSRGAFGRRLFGSTAVRVMRSAACPVLAVPERMPKQAALDTASASTSVATRAA